MPTALRLLLLAAVFAVLLYAQLRLTPYAADDAYIHLRIVENFLNTGRPYFNPPEAVLATSSSPWTLLLALLFSLTGVSLKFVALICTLCTFCATLLWVRLIRRVLPSLSLISEGTAFLVILAALAPSSFQLMEAPLALLLLALGLLLYESKRTAAFLFLALAACTRLEFTLFFLLFLVVALYQRRLRLLPSLLFSAAGALPCLAFLWHYFGTLLPNTISAKSAVYQLKTGDFIQILGRAYINEFSPETTRLLLPALALLIMFFCGSVVLQVRELNFKNIFESYGTLFLTALAGLGIFMTYLVKHVFLFPWYLPLFVVPLLSLLLAAFAKQRSWPLGGLLLAASAVLVFNLARDCSSAFHNAENFSGFAAGARVRKYLELGRSLRELFPGSRIMAAEIGALGFGFKGPILDGCGLVSPGALVFHPLKIGPERSSGLLGAIPGRYAEQLRPELVVGLAMFMESFERSAVVGEYLLFKQERFLGDDLERARNISIWGSYALSVYVRKDLCTQSGGRGCSALAEITS